MSSFIGISLRERNFLSLLIYASLVFSHNIVSTFGSFPDVGKILSKTIKTSIFKDNGSCLAAAPAGTFQGVLKKSVLSPDVTFCAFSGIRYGKPISSDNRFADPEAAEPVVGVKSATVEGPFCAQNAKGITFGVEDCLFLNVYKPAGILANTTQSLKAVIVYIHGGGLLNGASSSLLYSPDPLMEHDVVVVCMSYRLAAFGFLSLGIKGAGGNMGSLDQVLALQWVQKNIESFGGDPNNVTLMGESAGGWSTYVHALSPKSRGLISKAIIQSAAGTELIKNNTESLSIQLVKHLGYTGDSDDREGMLQFLRKLSTIEMSDGFESFRSKLYKDDVTFHVRQVTPFYPVIDSYRGEDAFLPEWPDMSEGVNDLPVIAGQTTADGTAFFFAFVPNDVNANANQGLGLLGSTLDKMVNLFMEIPSVASHFLLSSDIDDDVAHIKENLPAYLPPIYSKVREEVAAKVRKYYFESNGSQVNKAVQLVTDLVYDRFYDQMAPFKTSYIYQFGFEGSLQALKLLLMGGKYFPEVKGIGHADDIVYSSFYPVVVYPIFLPTPNDRKVIRQFTKLLTNFAKTGNPNSDDDGLKEEWKPMTPDGKNHLQVDLPFRFTETRINEDRRKFWDQLPRSR